MQGIASAAAGAADTVRCLVPKQHFDVAALSLPIDPYLEMVPGAGLILLSDTFSHFLAIQNRGENDLRIGSLGSVSGILGDVLSPISVSPGLWWIENVPHGVRYAFVGDALQEVSDVYVILALGESLMAPGGTEDFS